MSKNNKDIELKGGLQALFGEDKTEEPRPIINEEKVDIIETIEREDLKEALRKKRMEHRGRPKKDAAKKNGGLEYSRTSLIVNQNKYAKVREIALQHTLTTKEVVELAFDLLIEQYEAVHGEVIVGDYTHTQKDVRKILEK